MIVKAGLIVAFFMHMAWERLALMYAILLECDRRHNAEIGINWDVIRVHADNLFPETERL
jgi:hypothetical protein